MSIACSFANPAGVIEAITRALKNLIPPRNLKPSEWAEANVVIPVGNAIPGPINLSNAPFQREPLDVAKMPGCYRISLMFGAQTGKTTIQQMLMGYFIAHEPRSQIVVQPTQGDMQTFLETKLRPMFDANPAITDVMAKQRGRDGVNNNRIISYIGGWLMTAWAGSPKTLRGRSAPVAIADEIDGMEATAEGDPVQLLVQRSATFGDQRLLVESSTPITKDESRIEPAFLAGDQRRYYVPCPHCRHYQVLKWQNVVWTGRDTPDEDQQPDTARYACEDCGAAWDDGERLAAIRNGEWRAAKPFRGHASFHLPELCSTFRRLREIVQSYLDKIAVGDVQSFVNVSLAETYEEAGEKANPTGLLARREEYPAPVPAGGVYLTVGIDMQVDRLELEIVAWGVGEESWNVDFRVLYGDPLAGDVWQDLDEVLDEEFAHESGVMLRIGAACLDTGGTKGYTQSAYEYARGKTGRRLFAIKGVGGWGRAIVEKPQRKQSGKNARKVDLFLVGVDEAKLVTMRRLAVAKPGPGYCHFPLARDEEYFEQITAEKMVTRYVKGQPIREWRKPDKARNEALDCRNYAYAALKITQPNLRKLAERIGTRPILGPAQPSTEIPQEETSTQGNENQVIKRPRKTRRSSKGTWATKW